jgi:hypothetical protein
MNQLASVPSPLPSLPADKTTADDDVDIFLLHAGVPSQPGQLEAKHVLIVAEHGIELLRGLIRRGCPAATCIRPATKPETAAYELVCFQDIIPETDMERLIHDARRAILPGGRLVARVSRDSSGRTTQGLVRRLKLNGFINVLTSASAGCSLLRADFPAPVGLANRSRDGRSAPGATASSRRMS